MSTSGRPLHVLRSFLAGGGNMLLFDSKKLKGQTVVEN